MPNKEYTLTMARYNCWQNESMLTAAGGLSPEERQKDRGAFFGSIQKTASHLFWGDMIWMNRFAGTPAPTVPGPESVNMITDWGQYCDERTAFDKQIIQWAQNVSPGWFDGDLSWYSGATGRNLTKSKRLLVIQLFNHQTHHRGQIHAMLTAASAKTDDTDVPFIPDHYLGV
ncbi:MAG: DinB family protein [Pikeienuella sp.]